MTQQDKPASSLAGKTIITVEDEGVTQMQLRRVLTRAGLLVVAQAFNGREGVELVLRERPDIVTMDITMPDMDGIEATRQILQQGSSSLVVMVTAYSDEQSQQQAREAGACGYIVKPITAATLLPALERIYAEPYSHDPVHRPRI